MDFRSCLYGLSDVIINRPTPLRVFDQIYMKLPDMLLQAELTARWCDGKTVLFIGDGDAIALAMMHLSNQKQIKGQPKHATVLDFDERIVNSVIELASNPPRFLVVKDESRCRPFNRQGNRFGFACTQVQAQGLSECLILHGMNLHPRRQSSTTFLHHGVRHGDPAVKPLQDAERSGGVQRDQAATI